MEKCCLVCGVSFDNASFGKCWEEMGSLQKTGTLGDHVDKNQKHEWIEMSESYKEFKDAISGE
jgi:hypothetical protein